MIWQAIRGEGEAVTDGIGNEVAFTDGFRSYSSMNELLIAENLDILFPASLPEGYAFTDFEVIESGGDLRVQMSAMEPFIELVVRIGANIQLDGYDYEINGMVYRVLERGDGLYQADFAYNADYYTIAIGNQTALSEIIENLARE
jgi:hypothetical protein